MKIIKIIDDEGDSYRINYDSLWAIRGRVYKNGACEKRFYQIDFIQASSHERVYKSYEDKTNWQDILYKIDKFLYSIDEILDLPDYEPKGEI